jgi:hypothetical protein
VRIGVLSRILLVISSIANADTIAATNDGGGAATDHANNDDAGWVFTNSSSIDVTQLGIWENGSLQQSHQGSIYDTSGNLQVSAILPVDLTDANADSQGYEYVTLSTPFTLAAGTWFIGAYYNAGSDFMRVGFNPDAGLRTHLRRWGGVRLCWSI